MRGGAAVPPRQLFVVVEGDSAGMRMRLAPVGSGGERFAVVNHDVGIAAIEYLGDGDRDALKRAYHVFRSLDLQGGTAAETNGPARAFAVWREALARAGFRLRLEREALYGGPLPGKVWSADGPGVSLRPWDIELTALEAQVRHLVKFDRVPRNFADTLRNEVERRGLLVETVIGQAATGDDATTLVIALDTATLAAARELEARLLASGDDPTAGGAAALIGELLGYPPCCVQRFAGVAEHNDTALAWALLPGAQVQGPCFTQWLQPGLALLSHSPCDPNCAASIELAQRLLAAVDAEQPGFAARWRRLATRVQVVDQAGNRMALAVQGSLESPQRVLAADLLASSAPQASPDAAASLVDVDIVIACGGLVAADREWYAPYVADHRG